MAINSADIHYLTFEGGGGKGIVYLGAVIALESKICKAINKPLVDIYQENMELKQIKGISGASAGAITAFMLSIGMSSYDIRQEIDQQNDERFSSIPSGIPESVKISSFEKFFEKSNPTKNRALIKDGTNTNKNTIEYKNYSSLRPVFQLAAGVAKSAGISDGIVALATNDKVSILKRRVIYNINTEITDVTTVLKDIKFELGTFMHSLFFNRGLFVGIEAVSYFKTLIKNYLMPKMYNLIMRDMFIELISSKTDFDTWFTTKKNDGECKPLLDEIKNKYLVTIESQIQFIENYIKKLDLSNIYKYIKPFLNILERLDYGGTNASNMNKQNEYFLKNYSEHLGPEDITFSDLFKMTKINLVLTGSNITQGKPKYFSVYHTPDLSVVHAIAISMSIPIAFKPVYIGRKVKNSESDKYNNLYKGLYVDGGLLNNFPIHAFNQFGTIDLTQNNVVKTFSVAKTEPNVRSGFNKQTFGFRLIEESSHKYEIKDIYGDGKEVDGNKFSLLFEYFGQLFGAIRYDSTEGQIAGVSGGHIISLVTTGISVFDFSSPQLDLDRKTTLPDSRSGHIMDTKPPPQNMGEYKTSAINYAETVTRAAIT